jgi:integrase
MSRRRNSMVPTAQTGSGMLCGEANSAGLSERGELEQMAKRRFQAPKPKREGHWWYLLYRQDEIVKGRRVRRKVRVKLAPATMPEREVKKLAAEHLRPMNQGLQSLGSATAFMDFVENTYKPTIMPTLSASTRERYASVLKVHLVPVFGQMPLRDISPLVVQRFISGFASGVLAHESLDKIRDVLAAVLGAATQYGLLVKNPVEGVRLPPPKKRRQGKPFLMPDQLLDLVDHMEEPYATMVFTAGFTGLRPSEVEALKWGDIGEDSIRVDERYWRGDWSIPKSDASAATIAVPRAVIERIHRLKLLKVEVKAGRAIRRYPVVKSDGPEDLVFQSVKEGGPMRDNFVLARHIKPVARKLGIGWVNWQVLRRSFATMLKMAGADIKDAQALMRHSRASTTLDVYQQQIPASQRRVVEDMGRLLQPSSTVNKPVPEAVPLLFQ